MRRALALVVLISCGEKTHRADYIVMGTQMHVAVRGPAELLDSAWAQARLIDSLASLWHPSELRELNRRGGGRPSPELLLAINLALAAAETTRGAFDPTVGPLVSLWGFKGGNPHLPPEDSIGLVKQKIGYEKVKILGDSVNLGGTSLDLAGVAKGLACDLAAANMRMGGAKAGLVEIGGDVIAFGDTWVVALRNPRRPDTAFAYLKLKDLAVCTSGDYERFFLVNGERYSHIIDPRTGYPAKGAISATVIAKTCAWADALATALCVLGPEGIPLIERLPDVEGMVIWEEGGELKTVETKGFSRYKVQ